MKLLKYIIINYTILNYILKCNFSEKYYSIYYNTNGKINYFNSNYIRKYTL